MIPRLFLTLVLLLLTAAPCLALEATIKSRAEVDQATVTLGDICDFSAETELTRALASQIVSPAPEPGQSSSLDARQIIARLAREHGPIEEVYWKGSAEVVVERSAQLITPQRIQEIIDEYLVSQRDRLPRAEIAFKPDSLPLPFALPTGELAWEVLPSSSGIIGSSRFSIIFTVDGRVRHNLSVRGRTEAIAPVVVARKRLRYGEIITPEMVDLAPRDLSEITNYLTDPEQAVGCVVKRALTSGAALDSDAVERPPVVHRGELVKIVISHHGLIVTATGIAKSNGRKDEIIRVQNTSSNKLIFCRVHAPGLVEVSI